MNMIIILALLDQPPDYGEGGDCGDDYHNHDDHDYDDPASTGPTTCVNDASNDVNRPPLLQRPITSI